MAALLSEGEPVQRVCCRCLVDQKAALRCPIARWNLQPIHLSLAWGALR